MGALLWLFDNQWVQEQTNQPSKRSEVLKPLMPFQALRAEISMPLHPLQFMRSNKVNTLAILMNS